MYYAFHIIFSNYSVCHSPTKINNSASFNSFRIGATGISTPLKRIQRDDGASTPSRTKSLVGTIEYLAPEVAILFADRKLHADGYTRSIDFWSLGVMIYKMLTFARFLP